MISLLVTFAVTLLLGGAIGYSIGSDRGYIAGARFGRENEREWRERVS